MSLLNPVVSKFTLTEGVPQEVYSCPLSKSHAIIDLSFFKNVLSGNSLIGIALSAESNPANLTSTDFFIDDIELIGTVNSAELSKVVVGSGERLYIKVLSGVDIVVRLSGVEESNPLVLKGGRLAALATNGTAQTKIYENNLPNTAYATISATIFNVSETESCNTEMWISTSESPSDSDKILNISIPFEDTTIIENILLAPGEKVFVKSDKIGTEYYVNGLVVAQS